MKKVIDFKKPVGAKVLVFKKPLATQVTPTQMPQASQPLSTKLSQPNTPPSPSITNLNDIREGLLNQNFTIDLIIHLNGDKVALPSFNITSQLSTAKKIYEEVCDILSDVVDITLKLNNTIVSHKPAGYAFRKGKVSLTGLSRLLSMIRQQLPAETIIVEPLPK